MLFSGLRGVGVWRWVLAGAWGWFVGLIVGVGLVVGAAPAWAAGSRIAYVADAGSDSVIPIDTATNTPGAAIAVGVEPEGVAVTPDGKTVYVVDAGSDSVTPIDTATNTPGTAIPVGSIPEGVAVTPDGKTVYVANVGSDSVTPIDTATNTPGTAIPVGIESLGVVVAPDQGPVAAFSVTAASAGKASSFDASASSDPDGSVASYHWQFGDGSGQTRTSAKTTHTYATPNAYTVTLTVTDDEGCSTALVFTGQTASCDAAPQAQTTRQLTVAAPPPLPPATIAVPTAQISSPQNGAHYARGRLVRASYACQDATGGPGISSCSGPVPAGQPINTTTVGKHAFTVTATSKDGQRSTSTTTYTVRPPDNHFTVSHITTHHNATITLQVKVPGGGRIDVLETAWNDNLAQAAVLLQPARRRFVVARHQKTTNQAGTLKLRVTPNQRGKQLEHHHTYRVTLRLWVTYTPTGGQYRNQGFYGLHLPQ